MRQHEPEGTLARSLTTSTESRVGSCWGSHHHSHRACRHRLQVQCKRDFHTTRQCKFKPNSAVLEEYHARAMQLLCLAQGGVNLVMPQAWRKRGSTSSQDSHSRLPPPAATWSFSAGRFMGAEAPHAAAASTRTHIRALSRRMAHTHFDAFPTLNFRLAGSCSGIQPLFDIGFALEQLLPTRNAQYLVTAISSTQIVVCSMDFIRKRLSKRAPSSLTTDYCSSSSDDESTSSPRSILEEADCLLTPPAVTYALQG